MMANISKMNNGRFLGRNCFNALSSRSQQPGIDRPFEERETVVGDQRSRVPRVPRGLRAAGADQDGVKYYGSNSPYLHYPKKYPNVSNKQIHCALPSFLLYIERCKALGHRHAVLAFAR
jgi:hypothetical protein